MTMLFRNSGNQNRISEHPAVSIWRAIQPECAEPSRVELIKGSGRPRTVYRLEGVGYQNGAVIAKRYLKKAGMVEKAIYERFLPLLPVTVPYFYGFFEEDGDYCWIFLQDVKGLRFSPSNDGHRQLAANWLASLHSIAAPLASEGMLPYHGSTFYLEHMQAGRRNILENLENSALGTNDRSLLRSIIASCDSVEASWSVVENFCRGMPITLVHGDFRGKNVFIRNDNGKPILVAIDWEHAGWGFPAVDLAAARLLPDMHQADVTAYWSGVHEIWSELSISTIRQWVVVGFLFRQLSSIYWDSLSLNSQYPQKAIIDYKIYLDGLTEVLQKVPWLS